MMRKRIGPDPDPRYVVRATHEERVALAVAAKLEAAEKAAKVFLLKRQTEQQKKDNTLALLALLLVLALGAIIRSLM
jgi:hypothetical protein